MDKLEQKWVKNLPEEEQVKLLIARNQRRNDIAREQARKNKLKILAKKYNLTEDALKAMMKANNNRCEICGSNFSTTPSIDHCHITNKVRGILCVKCNTGLGYFKDSPHLLTAAANYLKEKSDQFI